ncbi:MAG: hypothetical protein IKE89_01680 [Bacilli bacterium]|nr:hypothetical protein [Bacilli bacterium]
MGFLRDIILGPDKNDKEKQEDFDEFMELQKKRKEEIKNKKRGIFSIDEEVEGNDDMFDVVDFLNDEDKKEEER